MGSWTAISTDLHAKSCFRLRQGFEFADNQQIVGVLIEELAVLIPHYACAFIKDDAGSYKLVALLGLGGERNLFVNFEHKWLCEYVPAALRAYPFTLADKPDSDSGEKILCIDTDYLTDESEAKPIFDGEGNLGSEVARVLDFLNKCDRGRVQTQNACAALENAGLIRPWELSISKGEGQEPQKVSDLYQIDEMALSKLDSSVVTGLISSGALGVAYAQLFSMHQIYKLDKNLTYLNRQQMQRDSQPSVAGLFGEDEGSLNFDGF
jgi:hypothetical protein